MALLRVNRKSDLLQTAQFHSTACCRADSDSRSYTLGTIIYKNSLGIAALLSAGRKS